MKYISVKIEVLAKFNTEFQREKAEEQLKLAVKAWALYWKPKTKKNYGMIYSIEVKDADKINEKLLKKFNHELQ